MEALSPVETKRMALGLSGMLDFIENGQAAVLNNQDYRYLKNAYEKKFRLSLNKENPVGWMDVATKCENIGLVKGRKYLDSLCGDESLTEETYQLYKLYDCVLNLIQNNQHTNDITLYVPLRFITRSLFFFHGEASCSAFSLTLF